MTLTKKAVSTLEINVLLHRVTINYGLDFDDTTYKAEMKKVESVMWVRQSDVLEAVQKLKRKVCMINLREFGTKRRSCRTATDLPESLLCECCEAIDEVFGPTK